MVRVQSNTIVTGGSGLVGSQFGGDVISLSSKDCDLRDSTQTERLFSVLTKDGNVKSLIHCAARVGGLGGNMNHKGSFFYDNITMNTNVIEMSRRYGIEKLVCFLSTCVFPDDVEYPLTEEKVHLGPPHWSNDAYAYAKRMADVQIKAYGEQYGLKYCSVIPSNIYGPNDLFDVENGHVIPALISKCYEARETNSDFVVWGSGKPLREFIYSEDVAKLSYGILKEHSDCGSVILSTSQEISIMDLVDVIVTTMGFKGKVIFDSSKPDGQYRKPSDNSKLKSMFPDFEFTKVEDGIRNTIEWFEENVNQKREKISFV